VETAKNGMHAQAILIGDMVEDIVIGDVENRPFIYKYSIYAYS
jgi:hypothetical protein